MAILHLCYFAGGIAALDALEQYTERCTRPGFGLMFYRCQANVGDSRRGKIVEAADAVILRHAESFVGNSVEYAVGYEVVGADKTRDGAFSFKAFYGEFVAYTLFYIDTVQFFQRRMVTRKYLHRAVSFLLVGIEHALQAVQTDGIARVHHGSDEGNMPVP